MSGPSQNSFLSGPMAGLFAKTALPIIFVMTMNGLLNVADALFLGHYVGADALAAVTLIFPIFMLSVAFSTLVSGGMSSLIARHLGGNHLHEAQVVFASAHWLALAASAVIIALYVFFGAPVILLAAGGDPHLAEMASIYLSIIVFSTPLSFVLGVNVDGLRNEGHVMSMAMASLVVSISNIGFNYMLIGVLQMGVAGSAIGTVLAQALALTIVAVFRLRRKTVLHPFAAFRHVTASAWSRILALGAPMSLNFIGASLSSSAILAALQIAQSPDYAATVSAYGIITRITTFTFLPLMGLGQAMQTITGNNYGAGKIDRVSASFRFAAGSAFVFCLISQAVMVLFAPQIGGLFISNAVVIERLSAIMPVIVTLFFISGPMMMVSTHFQAIGDAGRAAVLSLTKPYIFYIPMVFMLALNFGDRAIWWAGPMADVLLLGLTFVVLLDNARRRSARWGLFAAPAAARA